MTKKHKILVIGPTPSPYTGMSVATSTILNSSLKDKFEIIHVDTSDRREISNMGKLDLVNITLALKHFLQFIFVSLREKPDLVYLPIAQNVFGFLRDALFLIPCRIFKIKTVVHLHGGYFKNFYRETNILVKKVIHFSLAKVSGAIVLGECLKYIFEGLLPPEKIFVVPNGVDDYFAGVYRPAPQERSFNVLFLSNLLRQKGFFEVLKVIPSITSVYRNVRFIFAGEWESSKDKKDTREFIKNNHIEKNTEFIGVVKGEEKKRALNEADLFVLPTYYPFEGQPLVILEAMSAALAVIATSQGAISETMKDGENGFLVEANDSEQLKRRILELILNPELCRQIGQRNRERYLENYTQDIFTANLYNVLESVISGALAPKHKILFIAPMPPPYAGPEVNSKILLESSLRDDFELIHVCSNLHDQNRDKGKVDLLSSLRFISLISKIFWVFILERPRTVYTLLCQNFTGFMRDSVMVVFCKLFGKKIFLHFHGSNFENFYRNQPRYFKAYISFILRRVDFVILQADWLKQFFSQFIPVQRLRVIHNPIPINQFARIDFMRKPAQEVKVFYMSHISVAKGFAVLARAMKEIVSLRKNIKFIIAGGVINKERNIFYSQDGEKIGFEDINQIIRQLKTDPLIKNQVVFLDEVTDLKKKRDIFSQSDIFILPSYSEGCPIVVLEAMAAGLPVVTTPVGALSEIIRHNENGLFVRIGDSRDLVEKVLLLADNPALREKLGRNNRELISASFTIERIIPQFSELFREGA